ncbi:unnamed protein product [Hermetia illucens]|uniref:Uncharacterized protein n=1 Tax=Hermetia illucens TaxID=343691 RepID=A0A7R8V314_HERIL|nr:unnamed protein product [Hermetia illucens]
MNLPITRSYLFQSRSHPRSSFIIIPRIKLTPKPSGNIEDRRVRPGPETKTWLLIGLQNLNLHNCLTIASFKPGDSGQRRFDVARPQVRDDCIFHPNPSRV